MKKILKKFFIYKKISKTYLMTQNFSVNILKY